MSKSTRKKLKEAQSKLVDEFLTCADEIEKPTPAQSGVDAPVYYQPNKPDQLLGRIQQIEHILTTKDIHG